MVKNMANKDELISVIEIWEDVSEHTGLTNRPLHDAILSAFITNQSRHPMMRSPWLLWFFYFFFGSIRQVPLSLESCVSPGCLGHTVGDPRRAADGARRPLPLMPPPADLECAAPLPPFDNTINRSIRERARRHPTSKMHQGEHAGKGMPSHRVPEVMVWKCTMSLSVFCYVPVRWREKTGKRGSWWNDYIVAERGRGPRVEQLAETTVV